MPLAALFLTALALDAVIIAACFPLGVVAVLVTALLALLADEAPVSA